MAHSELINDIREARPNIKVKWNDSDAEHRDLDRVWLIKDYDGQLAEILKEEDCFLDDLIISIESEDGFSSAEVPYWEITKA